MTPDPYETMHTFRSPDSDWQEFRTRAKLNGTSASELLRQFIDWNLHKRGRPPTRLPKPEES